MNEGIADRAREAVLAHRFSECDIKKLRKKAFSLRRSRVPGASRVADEIDRIVSECGCSSGDGCS